MKRNRCTRGLPRLGAVVAVLACLSHAPMRPPGRPPLPPRRPRPRGRARSRPGRRAHEGDERTAREDAAAGAGGGGRRSTRCTRARRASSSRTCGGAAIQRPSRFVSDATGDTLNRSSWYDGKDDHGPRQGGQHVPDGGDAGTIDAVLDKLADEYGIVVPLSDFLYSDPTRR